MRPPTDGRRALRMTSRELGPVRYCRRCHEWYPEDAEFWVVCRRVGKLYHNSRGQPFTARIDQLICRACHRSRSAISAIRQRNRRLVAPCACGVRTLQKRCHGCAGRTIGPLTGARLAGWGLAGVVN